MLMKFPNIKNIVRNPKVQASAALLVPFGLTFGVLNIEDCDKEPVDEIEIEEPEKTEFEKLTPDEICDKFKLKRKKTKTDIFRWDIVGGEDLEDIADAFNECDEKDTYEKVTTDKLVNPRGKELEKVPKKGPVYIKAKRERPRANKNKIRNRGGEYRGIFRASRYYTPHEVMFQEWSTTGRKVSHPCRVWPKGFYEAVRCEGQGITTDGLLCSHRNITPRRKDHRCKPNPRNLRGHTAKREEPMVGRTIAVDFSLIPPRSAVRIQFIYKNGGRKGKPCRTAQCREWNGWYYAVDTGGAFNGGEKTIDIYGGIGVERASDRRRYSIAEGLPRRIKVYTIPPGKTAKRMVRLGHPRIKYTSRRHERSLISRYLRLNPHKRKNAKTLIHHLRR